MTWFFDLFTKMASYSTSLYSKMSAKQRYLSAGFGVIILFTLAFIVYIASLQPKVLLYKEPLSSVDFDRIVSNLNKLDIPYTVSGRYIYMYGEEQAVYARAQLGIKSVVRDVKGFELFNNPSFSVTDFERKVNLRRAIIGNMTRHIESLDWIDKADIIISYSDNNSLFKSNLSDLTASVSIKFAPFTFDRLKDKNKIYGLRSFIAKGIDRLSVDNVVILDKESGEVLTDLIAKSDSNDPISLAKRQLEIKEKIRINKVNELKRLLSMFPEDRYNITVDVDINWDVKNTIIEGIDPVVVKDPSSKYGDSRVLDGVIVSESNVKEKLNSPSYIPEGPAGVEPNVSPGAKEMVDRFSKYDKITTTRNKEVSTRIQETKEQPYTINAIRVAVVVDGIWEKKNNFERKYLIGSYNNVSRVYKPIIDSDIIKLKKLIYGSLSKKRGDTVEVTHFKFDRTKQFAEEDKLILADGNRILFYYLGIIGVVLFIIFLLIYINVSRYFNLKRLKKEKEDSDRRLNMNSEQSDGGANSDIFNVGVDLRKGNLSLIEMVNKQPEDAAGILRTWLLE